MNMKISFLYFKLDNKGLSINIYNPNKKYIYIYVYLERERENILDFHYRNKETKAFYTKEIVLYYFSLFGSDRYNWIKQQFYYM